LQSNYSLKNISRRLAKQLCNELKTSNLLLNKEEAKFIEGIATLAGYLTEKQEIESPNNVKVITDKDGFALYFSRSVIPYPREEKGVKYFKHIGVYAFRREALLNFAKLPMKPLEIAEKIECLRYLEYGMKIKMIETNFVGVGIDVPEDLEKAREILRNQ